MDLEKAVNLDYKYSYEEEEKKEDSMKNLEKEIYLPYMYFYEINKCLCLLNMHTCMHIARDVFVISVLHMKY